MIASDGGDAFGLSGLTAISLGARSNTKNSQLEIVISLMDGSHWGGRACGNKDLRYRGKACTNFVTAGVEDGIAGEA